jgi:hypothetical protein
MWELEFLRARARTFKTNFGLVGVCPPTAEQPTNVFAPPRAPPTLTLPTCSKNYKKRLSLAKLISVTYSWFFFRSCLFVWFVVEN